jgi:hypothetical protein
VLPGSARAPGAGGRAWTLRTGHSGDDFTRFCRNFMPTLNSKCPPSLKAKHCGAITSKGGQSESWEPPPPRLPRTPLQIFGPNF